jgi:molybdate transport system permease protein
VTPAAGRARRIWRRRWFGALAGVLAALLVALLAVPIASLVVTASPAEILAGFGHPVAGPALLLSLITTLVSVAVVVALGTPLAWWLARAQGAGARAIETLVALPVVIPPAVAGIALLLAFGRRGLLGPTFEGLGWAISFSTTAVVLAQVFVSAPFYVQGATAAFRGLDPTLLVVARSLGASPARSFVRVALPLARPGLVAAAAMSWARALGEFGATLMFAGNLPGETQTLPLAIYTALESDLRAAQALSLLLVVVAFGLLLLLRVRPGAPGIAGPGRRGQGGSP